MLTAITKREESFNAFKALRRTLERGAARKRCRCTVGFRGGSRKFDDVLRFPNEGFWALPKEAWELPADTFWCAYGVGVPSDGETLDITCEINPPYENPNFNYGGLFAKDQLGNAYLCHTGKIGGGRKGIGKRAFLEKYRGIRGSSIPVRIGDRKDSGNVIVLGRVNDRRLYIGISYFVREVYRVKEEIVKGVTDLTDDSSPFLTEFSGPRSGYLPRGKIQSNVRHGIVVGELAKAVERAGCTPRNDQYRDMYLTDDRSRKMSVLFEVKTSSETTDILITLESKRHLG